MTAHLAGWGDVRLGWFGKGKGKDGP
jgi:hypothetical protein